VLIRLDFGKTSPDNRPNSIESSNNNNNNTSKVPLSLWGGEGLKRSPYQLVVHLYRVGHNNQSPPHHHHHYNDDDDDDDEYLYLFCFLPSPSGP